MPSIEGIDSVEVLIIDDASQDSTFSRSLGVKKEEDTPFPIHVLFNPVNQGYGGNQKLGFQYVALDLEGYRQGSLNEVLHIKSA